jgi:hypothetical protein
LRRGDATRKGRAEVKITIELNRPTWLRRPRSRRGLTILLALLLTLGIPVGAVASDRFADVPTGSIFHDAINAIAGAGITLGCGAPNFCPIANVNREQMAAFMHRGLSRVGYAEGSGVAITTNTDLAVLTIKAGEATGGFVFVKVDAVATTFVSSLAGCPCRSLFNITADGLPGASQNGWHQITALVDGLGLDMGPATKVWRVPSGTTQTFRLTILPWTGSGMQAYGHMSAVMAPFGSQGTSAP